MSGSTLTAFNYIPENSEATPGLFNTFLSILSANIAEANSLGSIVQNITAPGVVTINADSTATDYFHFHDTSGQRSDYLIGSFNTGTADGLNIFDVSGNTMLVSFSKQSIRFYQNVVGPVFDLGGALTGTYNAATFGTASMSTESRIQAAINQASVDVVPRVYLPTSFYPYSASSVSFIYTIQMVREGGNWDVCDVQAYGAPPTLAGGSSTSAIQEAIRSGQSQSRVVYFPAGTYSVATLSFYSGSIMRGVVGSGSGSPPVQLYQPSASGPILQPADPTNITQYFEIEELTLSASGNNNNRGALDCAIAHSFLIRHVAVSQATSFGIRVTGGNTAGLGGFGTIQDCIFSFSNSAAAIMLVSTATDQPDGMLILNNFFSVSNTTVLASLSSFTRGPDSVIFSGNRVESSKTDLSIMTGYFSNARVIGNRFETTASAGTIHVALNPSSVGGTECCGVFIGNDWAAAGGLAWNDNGFVRAPRWLENQTGSIRRGEMWDGTVLNPAYSFASESSLGFYRSGTSAIGLSYGQLQVPTGSALQPPFAFSSDSSMGWFRSGVSGMALSYGSLLLPLGSQLNLLGGSSAPLRFYESGDVFGITFNRTRANLQDNTALSSWAVLPNINAGSGDAIIIAHTSPGGGNTNVASLDSLGNWEVKDGTAKLPSHGFLSETSLGFYRSGVSTLGLSYGAFAYPAGSAATPSFTYSSETSLGLYRSGVSTVVLSYGTLDVTSGGAVLSIASLTVKSGANNSCGTAVLGSNGSVNVANTYVKTGDLIFLTDQTAGGTLGDIELGGIRNASGFTILSTSITDSSTVAWLIVHPG